MPREIAASRSPRERSTVCVICSASALGDEEVVQSREFGVLLALRQARPGVEPKGRPLVKVEGGVVDYLRLDLAERPPMAHTPADLAPLQLELSHRDLPSARAMDPPGVASLGRGRSGAVG